MLSENLHLKTVELTVSIAVTAATGRRTERKHKLGLGSGRATRRGAETIAAIVCLIGARVIGRIKVIGAPPPAARSHASDSLTRLRPAAAAFAWMPVLRSRCELGSETRA